MCFIICVVCVEEIYFFRVVILMVGDEEGSVLYGDFVFMIMYFVVCDNDMIVVVVLVCKEV